MLKLTGKDGDQNYAWELPPGKHILGRRDDCSFFLPHSTVSRIHAELEVTEDGERLFLTDKESTNGTAVNGERIHDRTEIKKGDRILFGKVEFRIEEASEEDSDSPLLTITSSFDIDLEKSVCLPIDEALKPLPSRITNLPGLFNALADLASLVSLQESQEAILRKSLDHIAKVFPSARLVILLKTTNGEDVYPAASLLRAEGVSSELTLSSTIIRDILSQKQAILVSDAAMDARYGAQESIAASDLKSVIAVPMFDDGEVHGILYADTASPQHFFNDDSLRVLATFGNILASRLQSFAVSKTKEELRSIEIELRRASLIQHRLLVSEMPTISGYSISAYQDQGGQVGGDFYDVAELPDGRFVFTIGEVSGKGMGAALLMSNVLSSFRPMFREFGFDPGQALGLANQQLYRSTGATDFATLFIGVLDVNNHNVVYVNAGHIPLLLVHADGVVERLDTPGIMIGIMEAGQWTTDDTALRPGELLVGFTGGVIDTEAGDDRYGEDRLRDFVLNHLADDPRRLAEALRENVAAFAQNTSHPKDFTVLVLKRDY